ncbi:MAG: DISARM system SNF2-like helicase DrmD, partial [Acidimicrobiia bacterium]
MAPAVTNDYIFDTQRTQAIRTLAPHFEHRLFLTATPHNGYYLSFSSLLELLDDQRFARGIPLDQERLSTVLVRRLKDDIVDWKGDRKFPERLLDVIEVDYSDGEREIHAVLVAYTKSRQEAIRERGDTHATEFVLKLLKKRLFSSPAAFATTLEKHRSRLAGKGSPERKLKPQILKRALEKVEEDYADDQLFEESLEEAVDTATENLAKLTPNETKLLDQMTEWAKNNRQRADSKAKALLEWLNERLRDGDGWTQKRVLIFTEYRATQNWLVEILTANGYSGDRLMTMYGGMDEDKREKIKAAFQADPDESDVRILVATDAASEGIDLQNHCDLMVHMEVPWNPNRLEQRIGRIDRHGQKSKQVQIFHFVGKGYEARAKKGAKPGDLEGDLEFLMRAATKVNSIREDLGRVGPVIASQVEEAMLGKRNDLNTDTAEKEADAVRKVLRIERDIRTRIEKLHERVDESRKYLQLTPDNVRRVVEVGLELAGQPALQTR